MTTIQDSDLHGEIVTWELRSAQVTYDLVKKSLEDAGLNPELAQELTPRSAFSRACKDLKQGRAIDKLKIEHGIATFQFTQKAVADSLIVYDYECNVELDCDTGKVSCSANPDLEKQAAELIRVAMDTRNSQDVTKLVQKMFHEHADLYALNSKGCAYFTPIQHRSFTEKVELFLSKLGGKLSRFPVPKGTAHGNASVRDAVQLGLSSLLEELNTAVDQWDTTTRLKTMEKAQERLDAILYKVDVYQEYLGAEQDRLKEEAKKAKQQLFEKIMAIDVEKEQAKAEPATAEPAAV